MKNICHMPCHIISCLVRPRTNTESCALQDFARMIRTTQYLSKYIVSYSSHTKQHVDLWKENASTLLPQTINFKFFWLSFHSIAAWRPNELGLQTTNEEEWRAHDNSLWGYMAVRVEVKGRRKLPMRIPNHFSWIARWNTSPSVQL